MKYVASALFACLALAAQNAAQGNACSLSITTAVDPVRPVQTLSLTVDGSLASDPVYLAIGPNLGETTINLRTLGVLVLDLDPPFTTRLLGVADANGDLSRSYKLPSDLGLVLNAQAVGFAPRTSPIKNPKARFCKSNVVTFDL